MQCPVQALRSQVVTGPPHWPAVRAAWVQVVSVAAQGFYSLWFVDFPAASHLTSLGECRDRHVGTLQMNKQYWHLIGFRCESKCSLGSGRFLLRELRLGTEGY